MKFIKLRFFIRELLNSCRCQYRPRGYIESERDWIKDISCMYHWMKSSWYRNKVKYNRARND